MSLYNKPRYLLLFIKDEPMIHDTNAILNETLCVKSAQKKNFVYFSDIICKFDFKMLMNFNKKIINKYSK